MIKTVLIISLSLCVALVVAACGSKQSADATTTRI